jgi:opacity protein-like surface antigen
MTHTRVIAALATAMSLAAVPAVAADLHHAPAPRVIPAPIEVGGGWYLRGDVGIAQQDVRRNEFTVGNPGPFGGAGAFRHFRPEAEHFGAATIVGAGLGYQFNEWFRFDATLERRGSSHFGYTLVDRVTQPAFPFANRYTGQLDSWVGLINAYVDVGNFWGITPFVGAGIGFANHRVTGFQDQGVGASAGGYGIAQPASTTNFAWALHAGLGYAVNENLKLEISYRYMNLGDVNQGRITCFGSPCPDITYTGNQLTSHDIRVGMRWMLNPPPAAVPVAHRPVIARN